MTALADMPLVRNAPIRQGRTLNLARSSNMEAYLGQLTGQENATPCMHCGQKSAGIWTRCVSVEGFFLGSCANCHYNNEGVRCSLRMYFGPVLRCLRDNTNVINP
jgi:hypothetical protein